MRLYWTVINLCRLSAASVCQARRLAMSSVSLQPLHVILADGDKAASQVTCSLLEECGFKGRHNCRSCSRLSSPSL